jgi:2'-5' RNA ligase
MPPPPSWRCFVAIPISDELRRQLVGAMEALRAHPDAGGWRWTDPGGWHLTLAFLGSTDPDRVGSLTDALSRATSDVDAFTVAAGGVGVFPARRSARVLWYGTSDDGGRLADLAARVQRATGTEERRPYRGHLTLARARDPRGVPADRLLEAASTFPTGTIEVREVVVFRSHLGRRPAVYEALSSIPLAAVAAASAG